MYSQIIHVEKGAEVKWKQSRYVSYKLSLVISDKQHQPEINPTDNREVN